MIEEGQSFDASSLKKPYSIRLSKIAERAVLATAILNNLKSGRFVPPYLSFRQYFKKMELSHKMIRFSQAIRDEILQQFQFPANSSSTLQVSICQKLIIKTFWDKNGIIQCQPGIGMTTSALALISLTFHQTRFYYEAKKKSKYQEELQMLIGLKLLDKQVFKVWYWPIKEADLEQRSSEFLKALIISQAVELSPSQISQMKKFSKNLPFDKFFEKLFAFYPPRIQSRTIIDEAYIAKKRFEKVANETNFNLRKDNFSQAKRDYYLAVFEKQKHLLRLFRSNINAFQSFSQHNQIIASSHYRSNFSFKYFNYYEVQLFRPKILKKEYFRQAFLFELERNLIRMKISAQIIMEIKQFALKGLMKRQSQDFFRFSDIRQQFERSKLFQMKPNNEMQPYILVQEVTWMIKNWNALFESDRTFKFGFPFSGNKEWFKSPIK